MACDPRVDDAVTSCVSTCYENETDCADFNTCAENCAE
jgi:hypothetical protein